MRQKISGLWVLAIAFYGIGDTATTYLNLLTGFQELNPLINLYTLIPLKILIFIFLIIISGKVRDHATVPLILIILGLVGITRNLFLLMSSGGLI
ncbi:MAG: hypothetical protein R6U44_09255 [Archaeoglobaceae archaeon]